MIDKIKKGIEGYVNKHYSNPNTIILNPKTALKIWEETRPLCSSVVVGMPQTLLGLRLVLEEEMPENEAIVYDSMKAYQKIELEKKKKSWVTGIATSGYLANQQIEIEIGDFGKDCKVFASGKDISDVVTAVHVHMKADEPTKIVIEAVK